MINIPFLSLAAAGITLIAGTTLFYRRPPLPRDLSARAAFAIGAAWVAFITADFWLLGPHSYLNFGDEGSQSLPFFVHLAQRAARTRFDHAPLGGADAFAMFSSGYQAICIERMLFTVLPPWLALAANKLMVSSIAMASAFALARHAAAIDRRAALAVAAAFTLIYQYMINVTLVHSIGFAVTPLLIVVLCYRLQSRRFWLEATVVAAAVAVGLMPVQGGMPTYTALFTVALMTGAWRRGRFWAGTALVVTLHALNWADTLYGLASFSPLSSRIMLFERSFALDKNLTPDIILVPVLVMAVAAAAAAGRRAKAAAAYLLLFPFLLGLVLHHTPWQAIGLGFLRGLNYVYIAYAVAPLSIIALAVAAPRGMAEPGAAVPTRLGLALLIALPLAQAAYYKTNNFLYWFGLGAHSDYLAVPNLRNPDWRADPTARVAAVPLQLWDNNLLSYGFETLGGYVVLGDLRRAVFWTEAGHISRSGRMMLRIPRAACPERLTAGDLGDFDLLRISNVRYLVSKVPVEDAGLRQVSGPDPAGWVPGCRLPLKDKLRRYLAARFAPEPVFVYDMGEPVPKVFFATAVEPAAADYTRPEFWAQVRGSAPKLGVVAESGSALAPGPTPSPARVVAWNRAQTDQQGGGVTAEVEAPAGGVLVVNHAYLPYWHAFADGRPLTVEPVNGIQMAVAVPPGARRVTFTYDRWLPRDLLQGRRPGQPPQAP